MIVRVETDVRVLVGCGPEVLERQLLQREQEFSLVREKILDVGAHKLDHDVRALEFELPGAGFYIEVQIKPGQVQYHVQKVFNLRSGFFDCESVWQRFRPSFWISTPACSRR